MIEKIIEFDKQLFLFLNNLGCEKFDPFWLAITNKFVSIPLYLLIIYMLYKKYNLNFWIPILFIIILIFIVDQGSVHFFKNNIERLRPCHEINLEGLFRPIGSCRGKYGFVSSHASNVAALTIFICSIFKTRLLVSIMLIWMFFVGYSRIYLGVHFPADVLFGFFWGGAIALLAYNFYLKFEKK